MKVNELHKSCLRFVAAFVLVLTTIHWAFFGCIVRDTQAIFYLTETCIFLALEHCSSVMKPKRIRTTFSEDQLQILTANFNMDANPDGHDLERIAKLTGLSKRVTQVWFQNSRARQKKQTSNKGNLWHESIPRVTIPPEKCVVFVFQIVSRGSEIFLTNGAPRWDILL